jgi:ATP-dependent helicase/nuclease subunit A
LISGVQLSSEQADVVCSLDPRISVVASAGSGKTLVLVQRYLRHVLEEGIHPDRILTITFTRKAAAEMKSRIVAGLREQGAFELAQTAETGPIQTIHSLCEQLLRERAFEAGMDVKFEILSEAQSARYQFDAIEEALATANCEHIEAEALIAELAGKHSYGNPNSPYSRLRYSVREGLIQLRGAFVGPAEPSEIYRDSETFRRRWVDSVLATQPTDVQELYQTGEALDWRMNLQSAWKLCKRPTPGWLRSLPSPEEDNRSDRETCGIAQIALEAWMRLEARMEALQEFDFSYIEDRAVKMLRSCAPSSTQSLNSLADRFEVLMVDEAQDLNPKQHEIIEALGRERRLTVGDDRQSIYGFRLANPALFKNAYKGDAKRLSRNYRSKIGILNFVDKVFSETWKNEYEPATDPPEFDLDRLDEQDFTGVEFWELSRAGPPSAAKFVRELIAEGAPPGEICVLTRNGAACHAIHEELGGLGTESRIHGGAEKFYTRMEVRDVANVLRCLADPYNDFSLLATLRGPIANLSLRSIAKLAMSRPVVDALTSADLDPEDREKVERFLGWFNPIRRYADRLSAWEVLSRVLAETPLLQALTTRENGKRQIANVRKLLILAARDSHLGAIEFADQVRDVQELRHKEGDADEFIDASNAVRLMTIHKAKGLEFPIVVLPETNRKLGGNTSEIVFDPELKLMSTHFGGPQGVLYKALSSAKKDREVAEELRVLYVAMTRARRKLCIGIYPPSSGDTISRRIRSIIGTPIPDSIRYREQPKDC